MVTLGGLGTVKVCVLAWAEVGAAWRLPARSVAML